MPCIHMQVDTTTRCGEYTLSEFFFIVSTKEERVEVFRPQRSLLQVLIYASNRELLEVLRYQCNRNLVHNDRLILSSLYSPFGSLIKYSSYIFSIKKAWFMPSRFVIFPQFCGLLSKRYILTKCYIAEGLCSNYFVACNSRYIHQYISVKWSKMKWFFRKTLLLSLRVIPNLFRS